MGEFNSEEDYIYYCGQESLRRNGVALIIKSPKCHITCLLRNQYAGQEATVTTGHRKMDWFQTGKGVRQRVH